MSTTPRPDDGGAREGHAVPPVAPAALPVTGHPAIDAALASLSLGEDVNTHHDELAAALDVVQQALNPSDQPRLPPR